MLHRGLASVLRDDELRGRVAATRQCECASNATELCTYSAQDGKLCVQFATVLNTGKELAITRRTRTHRRVVGRSSEVALQ